MQTVRWYKECKASSKNRRSRHYRALQSVAQWKVCCRSCFFSPFSFPFSFSSLPHFPPTARPATSPSYVALRPDQRHEEANVYFTIPILMGIIVILFMVSLFSIGVFGLMNVQTMERWPDAAHDKNLIVPQ